ncbi:MAG: family 43 glycosylhydrolase [Ruminococcus sp.]|nr:family 43 glycosylhydrolase [Ruminococcus sp.]
MKFLGRIAAGTLAAAISFMSIGTQLKLQPSMQADAAFTVNNPIIWSDVPDNDVIRVGDTYYMISTTMYFSPGAPIMKSKDLVSWEICNYVYDTLANGDVQNLTNGKHDYSHGQWAASLRYHNGHFYVFFGSYGTGKSYIYKTDDIENGTWTRTELNGMYHDASLLFDDDGRNYLVYGGGEIKIKELNSDMTGFKQGGVDKTLFKTNIQGYVAGEGSHIQKIGDYYYIFIIAWPSGHGRLELCYRSKDLLGNYESKTVLESGLGSYGSGLAQGGIVDTPDGKWYAMVFQDHGAVGRVPSLVPVTWQNDWPMMGVNGKAPITLTMDGTYTGSDLAGDDDFSYTSNELALEWQWNHNPDNKSWSVTERDGWLRLHNNNMASHILNARNTLTMRTEGPACSSYIKLDTKGMKPGDHAGLSAFQLNFGNIGVYVTDSGAKKIYMSKNGGSDVATSSDKKIAEKDLSGDEVYLKVDFKFSNVNSDGSSSNNIDKANFYYSYDGSNWTKLGEELSMTYDLKLFTGYRSAIYSYPTKSTGGYADIDFFEYDRTAWNGSNGSKAVHGKGGHIIEPDENGYYFHNTFEGDTGSWAGRGAATILTSGRTAYEGKEALLVQERTAAWNGVNLPLNSAFKAGETYSFSTNAMYFDGPESQLFYLTMQYKDTEGTVHYDKVAKGTAVKGEWIQLANTDFQIPAGATELNLYVETAEGTDNFYIDDAIGAVAGTVIKGAGEAPTLIQGDVNCDGIIDGFDLTLARRGLVKGFSSSYYRIAADVDKSGEFEVNDLVLLNHYLLGKIKEFPVYVAPEPEKKPFNYNSALQFSEAPSKYLEPCSQAGKIVKETYNGINGTNSLNVYLPYGYDSSKKYNIFYLMHGGGENENTIFSSDVKMNNILDHMIMNGELEPLIVVTPTFNKCEAGTFYNEFRQSVVPFVEGKYSTYAETTTDAGLKASRSHRAYGGFSMGSLSAWCVADHCLDIVQYIMPLSGDNWEGINTLTNEINSLGLKTNEYFIFCATGSDDLAYPNMKPQIEDMKTRSEFIYTSDFSKGNFYFLLADGRNHWWGNVRHYIYDALPYFFHE